MDAAATFPVSFIAGPEHTSRLPHTGCGMCPYTVVLCHQTAHTSLRAADLSRRRAGRVRCEWCSRQLAVHKQLLWTRTLSWADPV